MGALVGLAGLAAGTTLTTISQVQAMRQRQAQVDAANRAQEDARQQVANMQQQAAQARMAQNQQFQAQSVNLQNQVNTLKRSISAGPRVKNPGALTGLATVATSPLGDTSDPYLGRRKLLGN